MSAKSLSSKLFDEVTGLLQEAAARIIVPGFRSLQASEIREKTPGEVVTVIDERAERFLTPALAALRSRSRVVGEEGTAVDPTLLDHVDHGEVWVVDPLDGTANFVGGTPDFAVMVALLRDGETLASWIWSPLKDELCIAERGSGALRNGAPLRARQDGGALRGIVKTGFLPPPLRETVRTRAQDLPGAHNGFGSAGIEYPLLARGEQTYALYWRMLPWDHAPGTLLVSEAGGHVAHYDGSTYKPAVRQGGLLVASSREAWQQTHAALLAAEFPLVKAAR